MQRTVSAGQAASLVAGFDASPAYRGLAESLRVVITDGRIPPGLGLGGNAARGAGTAGRSPAPGRRPAEGQDRPDDGGTRGRRGHHGRLPVGGGADARLSRGSGLPPGRPAGAARDRGGLVRGPGPAHQREPDHAHPGGLRIGWLRVPPVSGGLHLWCMLPEPVSSALAARAQERDVILAAGPEFAPEGGLDRFVRIPFTQPADVLADAVARLAAAWRDTLAGPAGPRRGAPTLVS